VLSTSNFTYVFVGACVLSSLIVHLLNKKANPLRKAWNVYSAMYILHFALLVGLLATLPAPGPSSGTDVESIDAAASVADIKQEIRRQREDIDALKNNVYATTQTVYWAFYTLLLFGPLLYYNLIKYNLRIEELSGKRMGSFD
jgi:hypothetical protein